MKKLLFILFVFLNVTAFGQLRNNNPNVYNVKLFGAKGDSTTDDCVAIRAAITAAFNAGGGKVFFPLGHYRVGCALQHSVDGVDPDAQIVLPLTLKNASSFPKITFEGEAPGNWSAEIVTSHQKNNEGVIIESSILDTGYVFGSSFVNDVGFGGNTNWTWWEFDNIEIRTRTKTAGVEVSGTMSGINSDAPRSISFSKAKVTVQSAEQDMVAPYSGTIGVRMPHWNNNGNLASLSLNVGGYYTGVVVTEHNNFHELIAYSCHNGIYLSWGVHAANINYFSTEGCVNHIYVSNESGGAFIGGSVNLNIGLMSVEHYTVAAHWNTYAYDVLFADTSTNTKLSIARFNPTESNVGQVSVFNTNAPQRIGYNYNGNLYAAGYLNLSYAANGSSTDSVLTISNGRVKKYNIYGGDDHTWTGKQTITKNSSSGAPLSVTNTNTTSSGINVATFIGSAGSSSDILANSRVNFLQNDATTNNYFNLPFFNQGGSAASQISTRYINHSGSNPSGDLIFYTMNASTTPIDRIHITYDGKIGINNTSPGVALDVTGAISGSSSITASTSLAAGTSVGAGTTVTAGTKVINASGTSGAPSYTFSSSSTAGLFYMGGDEVAAVGNNAGAAFAIQNTNSSGFSGIEYYDNAGSVKTFTGYENTGGNFRFNHLGSGGIAFKISGTDKLKVNNDGTITMGSLAGSGSRAVLADASGVLSAPVSDWNAKMNITDFRNGLPMVMSTSPVNFFYKKKYQHFGTSKQIGFIAQDIKKILPNSVYTNSNDGTMGYNEFDLIPVMWSAIQEQQKEIDALKMEIKKLKK